MADGAEREVLRLALGQLCRSEALAAGDVWTRCQRRELDELARTANLERQQHAAWRRAAHPLALGSHPHRAAIAGQHRDILLTPGAERDGAGHDPALSVEGPQLLACIRCAGAEDAVR